MNRYKVVISSMTFHYSLGYYYATSVEDAKQQAWDKYQSTFKDCSIGMLSAVIEN